MINTVGIPWGFMGFSGVPMVMLWLGYVLDIARLPRVGLRTTGYQWETL